MAKLQSIEQLRERYEQLNTRKIQLQTQKETAQKRLDELKQQANTQFGTNDLTELQDKLAEMKKLNAKQLQEYQSSLDVIEKKLASIDESFTE